MLYMNLLMYIKTHEKLYKYQQVCEESWKGGKHHIPLQLSGNRVKANTDTDWQRYYDFWSGKGGAWIVQEFFISELKNRDDGEKAEQQSSSYFILTVLLYQVRLGK